MENVSGKRIIIEVIDETAKKDPNTINVLISYLGKRQPKLYNPTDASRERVDKLFAELGLYEMWSASPVHWILSNTVKEANENN